MSAYLADDTLALDNIPSKAFPDGKTYHIPSLSGEDGLLLQVAAEGSDKDGRMINADALEAMAKLCRDADGNSVTLQRKMFGDALDEMVADGVSNTRIELILQVVLAQANSGTEVARKVVQRAAGEALARANRATRRAPAKKTSSPRKAGSKSLRASGAKSTPAARASTRGRATSAPREPQAKTA